MEPQLRDEAQEGYHRVVFLFRGVGKQCMDIMVVEYRYAAYCMRLWIYINYHLERPVLCSCFLSSF